jgi:hypothetical protein|tara:strand:+ start:355 stop:576 length:222 start_codon:yes stop_codon:yes gene_type:complete
LVDPFVDTGAFNGQIKHDVKVIAAGHFKALATNTIAEQLLVVLLALALKLLGFVAAVGNNTRWKTLVTVKTWA